MKVRPFPPDALADSLRIPEAFVAAPDVWDWALAAFIAQGSALENPDHSHLAAAAVGVLWTNVPNKRHMRFVAATAEVPTARGSAWQKARADLQLRDWFGTDALDFLITIDAVYAAQCSDAAFCALLEHELYHCGHTLNEFGAPRFSRDGRPVYGIRGHDAEEFVGVVRRYGVAAAAGGVQQLVDAAKAQPEVAAASLEFACGTCLARAA